jgi:hypothetical protein
MCAHAHTEDRLATLGKQLQHTLDIVKKHAVVRHKQGRHSEAEAGLRRALAGQRSQLGRLHASTQDTQGCLEKLLVFLGRSAAAAKREAAL